MSMLVVDWGVPIPIAIAAGVLTGVVIGSLSGRWITIMGVPSFVVTLGVGLVLNGLQLVLLPSTGRYNLLGSGVEKLAGTYVDGWARMADCRDRSLPCSRSPVSLLCASGSEPTLTPRSSAI